MATAINSAPNGAAPPPAAARTVPLLEIDRAAREVLVYGREVRLTRLEFALLEALAEHPAAIVSKERLLRDVWGYKTLGRTRTIDSHACRLRVKLADERLLHNVRGVGYRLVARHDESAVLIGERPLAPAEAEDGRPARPLSLVRGLDPGVELAVLVLAIPRAQPLIVRGRRQRVAALIESAREAGRALVELRPAAGGEVSVNPAHVVLVSEGRAGSPGATNGARR